MTRILKWIRHEVVVAGATIIAVGEGLATILPQPWQAIVAAGLPIIVGVIVRQHVSPVVEVEGLVARLAAELRSKHRTVPPLAPVPPPTADVKSSSPPSAAA